MFHVIKYGSMILFLFCLTMFSRDENFIAFIIYYVNLATFNATMQHSISSPNSLNSQTEYQKNDMCMFYFTMFSIRIRNYLLRNSQLVLIPTVFTIPDRNRYIRFTPFQN
jgi:hypothetical protein